MPTVIRAAIALALLIGAPAAPALAQGTPLPGAALSSVAEAGGQLFWTGPTDGRQISLYTRPAAGGTARLVGTVPGPGSETVPFVAFDGSNYALALYREIELQSDTGDCGVCENEYSVDQHVIAGRLDGAPKVAFKCSTVSDSVGLAPDVAIAAGRTFVAGLRCNAPAGVLTLDAAGALTSFDAAGSIPLSGNGNWLTYAGKDATKVHDLAGAGSYTVPIATDPNASDVLNRALYVQSDGSIVVGGGFIRTGGAAAAVPVRAEWSYVPQALFAGDRLFYARVSCRAPGGRGAAAAGDRRPGPVLQACAGAQRVAAGRRRMVLHRG